MFIRPNKIVEYAGSIHKWILNLYVHNPVIERAKLNRVRPFYSEFQVCCVHSLSAVQIVIFNSTNMDAR